MSEWDLEERARAFWADTDLADAYPRPIEQAIALKLPAIEHPLQPLGVAVVSNRGIWVPWVVAARGLGILAAAAGAGVALAAAALSRLRRQRGRGGGGGTAWAGLILVLALMMGWIASGASISVPEAAGRVVTGGLWLQTEFAALLGGLWVAFLTWFFSEASAAEGVVAHAVEHGVEHGVEMAAGLPRSRVSDRWPIKLARGRRDRSAE